MNKQKMNKRNLILIVATMILLVTSSCGAKEEIIISGDRSANAMVSFTLVESDHELISNFEPASVSEARPHDESNDVNMTVAVNLKNEFTDLIGLWVYSHSTEGEADIPVPTPGEFKLYAPTLEICDNFEIIWSDDEIVIGNIKTQLYESTIVGTLDRVDNYTYTISGIAISSEGILLRPEREDLLKYDSETGLLRYTISRAEHDIDDINLYFTRDST